MEKYILRWSYWLGLGCFLIGLLWKAIVVLGLRPGGFRTLTYMSFYKGGVLFLLVAIATTCYAWFKTQKQ